MAKAIGTLAGSGCYRESLVATIDDNAFVPQAALKRCERDALDALLSAPVPPSLSWTPPAVGAPRRRKTQVIAVAGTAEAAVAALDSGADAVWFDPSNSDLVSELIAEQLRQLPDGVAIRHSAVIATQAGIVGHNRPIVAGHLGVLRLAVEAGLTVIADAGLNCFGRETLSALGQLGAQAAVISLEYVVSARLPVWWVELAKTAIYLMCTWSLAVACQQWSPAKIMHSQLANQNGFKRSSEMGGYHTTSNVGQAASRRSGRGADCAPLMRSLPQPGWLMAGA